MKNAPKTKNELRLRRARRIRSRVSGTAARPRLAIFKSNRFISAQLVDDVKHTTLVAAHGREFPGTQSAQAVAVGEAIAKRAAAEGVTSVVFDRAGYRYTGQIKALAEAARGAGLAF